MNEAPPEEQWFRVRTETNAIDYLEKAAFFIKNPSENHFHWKWIIIGLHGALYGFAVAACKGTDSRSVLTKTKKRDRLIGFWEALKRSQNPEHMRMLSCSKHLVLSERQESSVKWLKEEFRNEFEHFQPKGWSIELHGFPEMAIDVLEVIRFLALEAGTYVYLNDSERESVKKYVNDSITLLESSTLFQEGLLLDELEGKGDS